MNSPYLVSTKTATANWKCALQIVYSQWLTPCITFINTTDSIPFSTLCIWNIHIYLQINVLVHLCSRNNSLYWKHRKETSQKFLFSEQDVNTKYCDSK